MPDPLPPDQPEQTPLEPPAVPPPVEPKRPWWRRWKLWLLVLLGSPVLLFVIYTVGVLNWAYSEGSRAGYLQKFSKKGWICKTWEGELALTTVPGVAPTLWAFTVRREAAARQLNLAIGRRVLLFYREHRGIPSRCFGDTNYFVDSLKLLP